jgi:membrane-associated phospholipid phosphatase
MDIPNLLSMSVGILYVIPLILYFFTRNNIHFKAFLGTAGTTIISETLKYFFIGKASPRPEGAKDCNLFCNDGNQAGRPGMPSSHSAEVAFFSGFYYQQTDNIFIKNGLVIYAGLVMLSRYIKRCHTINQIVTGALLGLSLSWFVVRQL